MASVYFKRGHQAALNALTTFTEGSFYLTDDTNRLYFAQSANNLVPLNQFIKIHEGAGMPSAKTGEILEDGDFYYLAQSNVLAIYKNGNWIQINPDTKLVPKVGTAFSVNGDTDANLAQVSTSFADTTGNTVSGNFKIKGSNDVFVTVNQNGEIVISATTDKTDTTYTIGTVANNAGGTIRATDSTNHNNQDITLANGDGISITSNNSGTVTIASTATINSVANSFDASGGLVTRVTPSVGTGKNSTPITPTISYGQGNTPSTAVFANGTAELDIYTADEIDDLLEAQKRTLDAMSYLGTLDQNGALAALTNVNRGVGDTFKASENITLTSPNIEAKTGDLIIASGSDDDIVWEVVPSGNDQFIEIEGSTSGKSLTFKDKFDSNSTVGQIRFLEDNSTTASKINIVATGSGTNNNQMKFQIKHGAAGTGTAQTYTAATGARVQQTGTTLTIPTVSAISIDEHGHIASISTVNYELTDTHATLNKPTLNVAAESNVGIYNIGLTLSGEAGAGQSVAFKLTSDNLTITKVGNDGLKANLEWGSF